MHIYSGIRSYCNMQDDLQGHMPAKVLYDELFLNMARAEFSTLDSAVSEAIFGDIMNFCLDNPNATIDDLFRDRGLSW